MASKRTSPAFKTVKDKDGQYRAVRTFTEQELLGFVTQLLQEKFSRGHAVSSPGDFRHLLSAQFATREFEVFWVAFLDNRHRVLAMEEMFRGTLTGTSVHPREVVKTALTCNAAAVIFAHNHPSGVAEPSQADVHLTRRLAESLRLVDVRVLDHFVVGGSDIISFAERGLL